MDFTKMHGCGNDYVYVDCTKDVIEDGSSIARFVSDRHFGIGSDGLILIKKSDVADFLMDMYNADGSKGEMCGNGIRCVAKFVYDNGLTDKTTITVETLAGVKTLELTVKEGKVAEVLVNMGSPDLIASHVPVTFPKEKMINEPMEVDGNIYRVTCVSMGNPHCVIFTDEDNRTLDLPHIGPIFENHSTFPKRTNTEFANILDRKNIRMRVWERGSGETLACGTGACATTVAAVVNGLTDEEVTMHLLGGDLTVRYDRANDTVWLKGPATTVFTGHIDIPDSFEKDDVKIYEPGK
ncbi:MAG: diaminopimelate epimerase [Lachnospiraceae bacterium]|uniref:Diaminopimelate epimerase n=1 Tax=Candidatus Weimeria bifida TaxID=2599074 RepID=A0A6N7IZN9_9FIRM|nr:diaminopimelate epimerase [Candidatus Weimeria bifida]RRF96275.1 MAG: diaminopimelate epimerase [Lachnospiraceae bacterium]